MITNTLIYKYIYRYIYCRSNIKYTEYNNNLHDDNIE